MSTVKEKAELLGATCWEYDPPYVDFYGPTGNFRGSTNLNYLNAKGDWLPKDKIVKRWNALPFETRRVLSNQACCALDKDYLEPREIYQVNQFQLKDKPDHQMSPEELKEKYPDLEDWEAVKISAGWWQDPAGGWHRPDEEDPAAMYE